MTGAMECCGRWRTPEKIHISSSKPILLAEFDLIPAASSTCAARVTKHIIFLLHSFVIVHIY